MTDTPSSNDKQGMDTRQKAIAGISALIFIVIIWQVVGMFGGGSGSDSAIKPTTTASGSPQTPSSGSQPPGMVSKANYPQQQVSAQIQAQIAQLQNETQQRYIVALNQLQLLKLSQQIVDINKDIAASKLDTVKSEKEIVDLLAPPSAPVETARNYSQNLTNPYATAQGVNQPPIQVGPQVAQQQNQQDQPSGEVTVPAQQQAEDSSIANYVVISVSKLMDKWGAVLGYQGRLYSVYVGDVMPIDGAKVKSINKYGVILEKSGSEKKVSLVPII